MTFDITKWNYKRDHFWTCNAWHVIDGKYHWKQWFTYDPSVAKGEGCPQHGTEFLTIDLPEPKKQRRSPTKEPA